ncbi:hypothetical protein QN277_015013 [Acacia crassicarpa]|uniref:Uncharacterized protein n=1 Tax=Acacia crassicarpa TaxID=499986 RepID=A0AAE1MSX1_9FABA|nr:hypothetical protein QN277_015013 [Acacia crassicarpa]
MASPGNPNQQPQQHHHHQQQQTGYDLQNLFKPSSNPQILNSSPSFPALSSSSSSSSYPTPSSSSYPPPTGIYPYYPHYLPYQTNLQQQQKQEQPRILPHLPQMQVPSRPMFQSPSPSSSPVIPSSPNPSNNSSGARLMAFLGTQQNPSSPGPEPT